MRALCPTGRLDAASSSFADNTQRACHSQGSPARTRTAELHGTWFLCGRPQERVRSRGAVGQPGGARGSKRNGRRAASRPRDEVTGDERQAESNSTPRDEQERTIVAAVIVAPPMSSTVPGCASAQARMRSSKSPEKSTTRCVRVLAERVRPLPSGDESSDSQSPRRLAERMWRICLATSLSWLSSVLGSLIDTRDAMPLRGSSIAAGSRTCLRHCGTQTRKDEAVHPNDASKSSPRQGSAPPRRAARQRCGACRGDECAAGDASENVQARAREVTLTSAQHLACLKFSVLTRPLRCARANPGAQPSRAKAAARGRAIPTLQRTRRHERRDTSTAGTMRAVRLTSPR